MVEMRNVAGEIMGAVSVIQYCVAEKIPRLLIYHDYEGVAKWATGEWKANKEGTKDYKQFCSAMRENLQFSFVKVKGHSGDRYNDVADSLAKAALGISE
ncbi:MAG: RNase H family protein [Oscillospiraceae bacterium]